MLIVVGGSVAKVKQQPINYHYISKSFRKAFFFYLRVFLSSVANNVHDVKPIGISDLSESL